MLSLGKEEINIVLASKLNQKKNTV